MRRLPRLRRALALLSLLVLAALLLAAAVDLCGPWTPGTPRTVQAAGAEGPLRAGASRVVLAPPLPATVAGYFPPLQARATAERPLKARAVVLEVAPHAVGLVSLDVLDVPDDVVADIRARVGPALGDVWVLATHTHSSFGGYDARPVAQVAALGRFRPEVREAVVQAAVQALREAHAALQPVQLRVGTREAPQLTHARSGEAPDARLTRVQLQGERAQVAELWLFAAHATLAGRAPEALSADFPGLLDEGTDGGVRLFLQGAVGNASASVPDGEGGGPVRFARALRTAGEDVPLATVSPVVLRTSRVEVALPRPDASRLVPGLLRTAGENLLCQSASRTTEVAALRLGPLLLVGIPGEPTSGAARALEARSRAGGVVGLANGYVGYVDTREQVQAQGGESRRQYFGPGLLEALTHGATVAVDAVR